MNTGCQRPANHDPTQTLEATNTSYLVKGTLDEHIWTVLSWAVRPLIQQVTTFFLSFPPGESVFSSKLKEYLFNVAVLMEAGFDVASRFSVVFRTPADADLDAVDPLLHPDYGGHITTPDGRQVMMIYFD